MKGDLICIRRTALNINYSSTYFIYIYILIIHRASHYRYSEMHIFFYCKQRDNSGIYLYIPPFAAIFSFYLSYSKLIDIIDA